MKIELDNTETTDAMAFYLAERYNLRGNASIDVVKQPKTGFITTTITLIPSGTATATEPSYCETCDDEPDEVVSELGPTDDFTDSDDGNTKKGASLFGN